MNARNAKEFLPIVRALADGKTIQYDDEGYWVTVREISFCGDPKNYRVKPDNNLRPWKPEEVPGNLLVRPKPGTAFAAGNPVFWWSVWAVTFNGPCFGVPLDLRSGVDWRWCLENLECSTDGGQSWQPCGVEE